MDGTNLNCINEGNNVTLGRGGGGGGGGGSSSGDKQLETQEKYCKFKMHQLLLPPSM